MQPITAAEAATPRDGLAGAVGLGVIVPDTDVLDPGGRWAAGFTLVGDGCGGGYIAGVSCDDDGSTARTADPRYGVNGPFQAFGVGVGVECSTFGGSVDPLTEWGDQARRKLARREWSLIARELWTGEAAAHQHLTDSASMTLLSETPVDPVTGVGLLEEALGSCQWGAPDLIHVARSAVPWLATNGLLVEPSATMGRLFTHQGSLVVNDRGYPGTGPDGADPEPNTAWLYGTGILSARLGDVQTFGLDLAEAVQPRTNDVEVRAERLAAIGWLCCHYGVQITLRDVSGGDGGATGPGLVV